VPEPDAVEVINRHAERIVAVSDDEVKRAMAYYFSDTHNVAEGAGAAPLAALLKERDSMRGKRIALILSGGNVDRELYRDVLSSQ
jgi:threonine dehydratase